MPTNFNKLILNADQFYSEQTNLACNLKNILLAPNSKANNVKENIGRVQGQKKLKNLHPLFKKSLYSFEARHFCNRLFYLSPKIHFHDSSTHIYPGSHSAFEH